jgi:hypothetical protein
MYLLYLKYPPLLIPQQLRPMHRIKRDIIAPTFIIEHPRRMKLQRIYPRLCRASHPRVIRRDPRKQPLEQLLLAAPIDQRLYTVAYRSIKEGVSRRYPIGAVDKVPIVIFIVSSCLYGIIIPTKIGLRGLGYDGSFKGCTAEIYACDNGFPDAGKAFSA